LEPDSPDAQVVQLQKVASRIGASLDGIERDVLREVSERLQLCDCDGISELTGWGRRQSARIVKFYFELQAGSSERRILKSPDARRLAKEILELFSRRASSPLGRNLFLFLAPSIDGRIIQERQNTIRSVQKDLGLLSADAIRKLRVELASLSIEGRSRKRQAAIDAPIIEHYLVRRKIIDTALHLMDSTPELSRLFSDSERKLLDEISRTLEEYSGSKIEDAEAIISDAELSINEEFRKARPDPERARSIVQSQIDIVTNSLNLTQEEESALRRAALEGMSVPFEFDRITVNRIVDQWQERMARERERRISLVEQKLMKFRNELEKIIRRLVYVDFSLAVAELSQKHKLKYARLGRNGISFLKGKNLFLLETLEGKSEVEPVDYSIGRTNLPVGAKPRNVVMLTGANSGGKTTLLTTTASIHILTLFGLPVPAEDAEVTPMPVYLYRRRVTKKIGSLEQALGSLILIFGDRRRKLVLMDEFEALTEPGAAGRILAGIINKVAATSSLLLLVTHLSRETLPHVKLPIRVDGIEAKGLDTNGELIVKRQPVFDHIGSSTPKLIIMKLANSSKGKGGELYRSLLSSLEDEGSTPVQTPIALPWLSEGAPSSGENGM